MPKKTTQPTGHIRFDKFRNHRAPITLPYFGHPTTDNIVRILRKAKRLASRLFDAEYEEPKNALKSNRGYITAGGRVVADFEIISGPDVAPAVAAVTPPAPHTKYEGRIPGVTFRWWRLDGLPIRAKHKPALEETAAERAHQMRDKGHTEGELSDSIHMDNVDPDDGQEYRGWWEIEKTPTDASKATAVQIAENVRGLGAPKSSVATEDYENSMKRMWLLSSIVGKQFQKALDRVFAPWDPKELNSDYYSRFADSDFVVVHEQERERPLRCVSTGAFYDGFKAVAYEKKLSSKEHSLTEDADVEELSRKILITLVTRVSNFEDKSNAFFSVSKPVCYLMEDGVGYKVFATCSVFGLKREKSKSKKRAKR